MSDVCNLDFEFTTDDHAYSGKEFESSNLASLPRLPIWNFQSKGITLHAKQAVSVEMSRLDVTSLAENERLGIIATGDTFAEALQDFQDQLVHLYEYFIPMDDSKLSEGAKKLKQLLLTNFTPLT